MATIKLEAVAWLARIFHPEWQTRLKWEMEVEQGAMVRNLFNQLADTCPEFGELVYDRDTQKLRGNISVIFNDRVLELLDGLDTRIEDGDSIVLLPAYSGGS